MAQVVPSAEATAFCGQRISLPPTYPFSPSPAFLGPQPASLTIPTLSCAAPGLCSPCPVTSLHLPWITQHSPPTPPTCTQPSTLVLHSMYIPVPNPTSFVHVFLTPTLLHPVNSLPTPINVLTTPSCTPHSGQPPRPSSLTHAQHRTHIPVSPAPSQARPCISHSCTALNPTPALPLPLSPPCKPRRPRASPASSRGGTPAPAPCAGSPAAAGSARAAPGRWIPLLQPFPRSPLQPPPFPSRGPAGAARAARPPAPPCRARRAPRAHCACAPGMPGSVVRGGGGGGGAAGAPGTALPGPVHLTRCPK